MTQGSRVMDMFKVLSRSTTLSTRRDRNQPSSSIPSSGSSTNPQLFSDSRDEHVLSTNGAEDGSKKRKRVDTRKESPLTASSSANTATSYTELGNDVRESPLNAHSIGTRSNTDNPEADDNASQLIEESERRRVLKQHKVRIKKLWEPSDESSGRRKPTTKLPKESPPKENSTKKKKQKLEVIPQPLTGFHQLSSRYGVLRRLVSNIEDEGYKTPTEVQLGGLPLLLDRSRTKKNVDAGDLGRINIDLLTVAPTGSGKTLAFLIPLIDTVSQYKKDPASPATEKHGLAIIIAPTKELAAQTANEGRKLTRNTGIKVSLIRKGMRIRSGFPPDEEYSDEDNSATSSSSEDEQNGSSTTKHKKATLTKAEILVATPIALLKALTQSDGRVSSSANTQFLVLDEADVLLDPLFREQTLQVWSSCTNPDLRVSLWSATMGSSIEDLAVKTIRDRQQALSENHTEAPILRLVIGLKDSALPNVSHQMTYAADEKGKLMAMRQILRPTGMGSSSNPHSSTLRPPFLVFTQTIPRAVALHSELVYDIPPEAGGSSRIAVLHADLSDTSRERVMTRFRAGEIWVLITTDLLSRGVDFRGVNGVVNYDFPNSSAAYVHRAGRTGRAGRKGGVVVTLYAKEDVPFLKNVANVIAASEKQRCGVDDGEPRMAKWLLESLPKPNKREKQELKTKGVATRRPAKGGDVESRKRLLKTRISTKSGFERKLEKRRRDQARKNKSLDEKSAVEQDSDFEGFD